MILVLMYMVKHFNYHHVYKNCHDLDMTGTMQTVDHWKNAKKKIEVDQNKKAHET